jgi:hypothetical protein
MNLVSAPIEPYAEITRSWNMIANCGFASVHSREVIFHPAAASRKTRQISFVAASSVGKCPWIFTARRSLALSAWMALVV